MPSDPFAAVDAYLREARPRHLADLGRFLAIPSISTLTAHRPDLERAADALATQMRSIGLANVALLETGGHPAVYGEWTGAAGRPTALVYGHYDVQPVDPLGLWMTPPFSPTEREGALYARGAADDKGQVWMHLAVAEAFLRTAGALPINLKVLIEGEEEVGSVHLPPLVAARRETLAADVIVISDTPMFARGVPSLCYGLRGGTGLRVHLSGPARDLHSGLFGGSVQNPLHAMARLVASLHDAEGRVAVEGFYDDVAPLTSEERASFASLPFDEAAYRSQVGVQALFGEPGYSTLERTWTRPTVEVNGMWGGYQGEGGKSIVPADAHALIGCRLVPDQRPERVRRLLRRHLEAHCPPGVRLDVDERGSGSPPVLTPLDSPYVRAAARALERGFGRPARYIRMGGSIPITTTLSDVLGAPVVLMGFGLPDDNLHAPNERFALEQYDRGQRAIAAYWLELASR